MDGLVERNAEGQPMGAQMAGADVSQQLAPIMLSNKQTSQVNDQMN